MKKDGSPLILTLASFLSQLKRWGQVDFLVDFFRHRQIFTCPHLSEKN